MSQNLMMRRDQLRPGDIALSSHYGASEVTKVVVLGNEGQTTHIRWWGGNPKFPRTEVYPSDSMIELIKRPMDWYLTEDGLIAWVGTGPRVRPVAEFEAESPIFAEIARQHNIRIAEKTECDCGSVDKNGDDLGDHSSNCSIWYAPVTPR